MGGIWNESVWICTKDPTGEFLECEFTTKDLVYTAKLGYWPIGITWHNQVLPKTAHYINRDILIQADKQMIYEG